MGTVRYSVDDNHNVTEIHKVVVHQFYMNEVDDPDIHAAQPIWEWQQSDAGKFVMENAIGTPVFHKKVDPNTISWKFAIIAELEQKKLSEFYLRWGKK